MRLQDRHLLQSGGGGGGPLISGTVSAAILALGPVSYWPLDVDNGFTDLGSLGNDMTTPNADDVNWTVPYVGPDGLDYVWFGNKVGSSGYGDGARVTYNTEYDNKGTGLTVFYTCWQSTPASRALHFMAGTDGWTTRTFLRQFQVWTNAAASNGITGMSAITATDTVEQHGWNVLVANFPDHSTEPVLDIDNQGLTTVDAYTADSTTTTGPTNLLVGGGDYASSLRSFYGSMCNIAIFQGNTDLSTVYAACEAEGWY